MKKIRRLSNLLEQDFSNLVKIPLALLLISILQLNVTALYANITSFNENIEIGDQQQKQISGTVVDEQGLPLGGVSIIVKNKNIGVESDFDGNFTIKVPSDTKELVFSYVGFVTETANIENNTTINITLKEDANILDEVVVTGYQTISKERATGSFVKINEEQLEMRPVMNIVDKLDGMLSGINYTNGEIEIRGKSSIDRNVNNQPLYVVDGFPVEGLDADKNPLQTLNPEDVQSVTVLKDASAASIWGVRASNGVVVITTKKGRKNQPLTVDFSTYLTSAEKIDYSKMNWMNTSDQIDLELEYTDKGWNNFPKIVGDNYGMRLLVQAQALVGGYAPNGDVWSQAQYDNYVADLRTRNSAKQWEDHLLRNPFYLTNNLAISGGSDNNTFRASLVYNDNKEASIGNSNNRFIIRLQDNYRFNDKLGFTAGITASMRNTNLNGVNPSTAYNEDAYNNLIDDNGQTIQYYDRWNMWTSQNREAMDAIGSYTFNQLDEQRNSDKKGENFDVKANFGLDYKIIEGLTFNSSFQYQKGVYKYDEFNSMNLPSQRINVWDMYADDATTQSTALVYQIPVGTGYRYRNENFFAWDFRNTVTWDKNWDKHKLTVFAGTEMRKLYFEEFDDTKYGYDKQTTESTLVNQANLLNARNWNGERVRFDFFDNSNRDDREVSAFSNVGYEFDNRFSVTGSFRVDQKNLFGSDPKYRYKPLWSTGIGWNLSNESFMDDVSFVDRLKLRATYGLTGNASNLYSPYAQAEDNTGYWGKIYKFFKLENPANNQLRWEETSTFNLAVDFALFSNRLKGTIEYYNRKSTDLLGPRQLDPTNGFDEAVINYASMDNNGFELMLNGSIIQSTDFKWNAGFNISYNKNTVTVVDDQNEEFFRIIEVGRLVVGESINNLYTYNYAGLDAAGTVLLNNTDGTTKSWKEGVDDVDELINHGESVAPWYGGFSNTFSYKDFDLSVNTVFKSGHKFLNSSVGTSYIGWKTRSHNVFLDRWKKPGDELTTRVPKVAYSETNPYNGLPESRLDSYDADKFWRYSQDNVLDGSFIRIKDVILGYSMPEKYLSKTAIKGFRITGQVANPFLWVANDKGLDPEAHRRMAYDNLKTFTFGVRLTF